MNSERNTEYRVELTVNVVLDLDSIDEYIHAQDSPNAASWYNGLEELILSLNRLPDRGKPTEEDRKLRQLLYGNRPPLYRVIDSVDHSRLRVTVAHMRHGARNAFRPPDVQ